MADDNKVEKIVSIQGYANDDRNPVTVTAVEKGRMPATMTPNDIYSGTVPIGVTPLVPGQPAVPSNPPAAPPPEKKE